MIKIIFFIVLIFLTSCQETNNIFRVMTWNIHAGVDMNQTDNLDRLADLIRNRRIDLATFQEVDSLTTRSGLRDQLHYLARQTGMHPVYARNIEFQGGGYGIGFLSRYKIMSHEHLLLPTLPNREQRGLLAIEIDINGHKLIAGNIHLDHLADDSLRYAQCETIYLWLQTVSPDLLIGDFNDTPDSRSVRLLQQNYFFCDTSATWPAGQPVKKIDYIFFNPEQLSSPVSVETIQETYSDHYGIIATWTCPF